MTSRRNTAPVDGLGAFKRHTKRRVAAAGFVDMNRAAGGEAGRDAAPTPDLRWNARARALRLRRGWTGTSSWAVVKGQRPVQTRSESKAAARPPHDEGAWGAGGRRGPTAARHRGQGREGRRLMEEAAGALGLGRLVRGIPARAKRGPQPTCTFGSLHAADPQMALRARPGNLYTRRNEGGQHLGRGGRRHHPASSPDEKDPGSSRPVRRQRCTGHPTFLPSFPRRCTPTCRGCR